MTSQQTKVQELAARFNPSPHLFPAITARQLLSLLIEVRRQKLRPLDDRSWDYGTHTTWLILTTDPEHAAHFVGPACVAPLPLGADLRDPLTTARYLQLTDSGAKFCQDPAVVTEESGQGPEMP